MPSNSIPAFPVLDYCPYGIGGLYCGAYKSCPSGDWGVAGELCVPEGSGIGAPRACSPRLLEGLAREWA